MGTIIASLITALATGAVAVLAACGSHEGGPTRSGSTSAACAAVVEWCDTTYYGERVPSVNSAGMVGARVLVCRKRGDPQFLKLVATRLTIDE